MEDRIRTKILPPRERLARRGELHQPVAVQQHGGLVLEAFVEREDVVVHGLLAVAPPYGPVVARKLAERRFREVGSQELLCLAQIHLFLHFCVRLVRHLTA